MNKLPVRIYLDNNNNIIRKPESMKDETFKLEHHKGKPYEKWSITYENRDYEYITKRLYKSIKTYITQLEQSLIEGNQNLQEQFSKLETLYDMVVDSRDKLQDKLNNTSEYIKNKLKEIIERKQYAIKTGNDEKYMKLLVEQLTLGEVNQILKRR